MVEFFLPDEIIADEIDVSGDADIGGDLTLSGDSPIFTMGSGLGSPDQIVNKADAGTYIKQYQNVGVARWSELFDANEDYNLQRHDGAGVVLDAINYDIATGLTSFPNDVIVNRGDAELSVGSGSGDPTLTLNKDDVGVARVSFENVAVRRWSLTEQATEDFEIERFNASAVLQDATVIAASDGDWTLPSGLALDSASPLLAIGDGGGTSTIQMDKSGGAAIHRRFFNVGVERWREVVDGFEDWGVERYNASGVFQETSLGIDEATGDVAVAKDLDVAGALNMIGDIFGSGIDIGAVAGEIATLHATDVTALDGLRAGNETALGGTYLSGTGVPANGIGANGDLFLRTDGGASTTLYQKRAGVWVATGA